jgi:hypothetical protein
MTHLIDDEIISKQYTIAQAAKAIENLNKLRPFYDLLVEALGESPFVISSYSTFCSMHWTFVVKDIAAEMAPKFEALSSLLPLEDWTSQDDPERRRRTYTITYRGLEEFPLTVYLSAVLAEDAICQIEVLGYKEEEVSEYITRTKSVPITRLICPGETE